jgi:maleate cis-trans isomerase
MPTVPAPGASYGWRASVGVIIPGRVSDTNAYEFYAMAPPGVIMVHTTLDVGGSSQEHYDRAIGNAETAVRGLVDRGVDAIVQAGVPPIVSHGWGFEAEVLSKIKRVTALPMITDIGACIEGMQKLQMRRVVMLTGFNPDRYGSEIHHQLMGYVANAGIEVVADDAVRTTPPEAVRHAPLSVPYRAAKDLFRKAGSVDGVWITGAFMPSAGMIAALEDDLGAPVVASMQALTWIGLRMAGIRDRVQGFGRLFQEDWPPTSQYFQG